MTIKRYFWLLPLLFLWPQLSLAHQPVFLGEAGQTAVSSPEISRAYYGFLPGRPVKFVINEQQDFSLYVNLLVPVAPETPRDLGFLVVARDGRVLASSTLPAKDWRRYYEQFAGDLYWQGPEWQKDLPAGLYTVVVYSPQNWGRYVLAIGEEEQFSLKNLPNQLREIYRVKTEFFQKSGWAVFEGLIGRALLLGLILTLTLVILALYFWRWRRRK